MNEFMTVHRMIRHSLVCIFAAVLLGQEGTLARAQVQGECVARFTELPAKMENLFAAFIQRRQPEESFLAFTRRHTIAELQSFCNPQENS